MRKRKMQKNMVLALLSLLVLCSLALGACAPAAAPVQEEQSVVVEEPVVEAPVTEAPTTPLTEVPPTEVPPTEVLPEPVVITDSAGNVVELETLPVRVVVAGKATPFTLSTTYLFSEAFDRVVAQEVRGLTMPEFLSLIDPKYEEKIKLEMGAGAEQIAPVEPDIVITKNYAVKGLQEPLAEIGIPVIGLNMEYPQVFYKDIDMLGQLFGAPERAAEINAYMQEKVAVVQAAMDGLADEGKPSVLVLQYSESEGEIAFEVPPASFIQTTMVIDGGGKPVWTEGDDQGTDWIVVNFEQIAAWDPDIILVIDYNGNPQETAEMLMQNDLWKELKSVKENQVYGFGKDYQGWDLPDPRWILGYTWVATKLQPERMVEVDVTAMVVDFYKFMYGLTEEQIETSIMPKVVAP
jgi:iron complex transport system substrate-binding protein